LIKEEIIIDYFPLHNEKEIAQFKKELLGTIMPYVNFDYDKIRDYFGERMMFYYLWMKFYTDSLLYPSILGTMLFFVGYFNPGSGLYSGLEILFALSLALWGTYFIISWRRLQSYYTLRYGTVNCKQV
jgi:hypothetical protein